MPVEAHIFVTTDNPLTDQDVSSMGSDLSQALGQDRFEAPSGQSVLYRVKEQEYEFLPDGLPHSVWVLQVRLRTPYYGPEYERGYWPEIAATLEFLRRRVPFGRVWYGRDDGDWVVELSPEALEKLWTHWAAHGGRPYHRPDK